MSNTSTVLTGLINAVSFNESTVNSGAQVLDNDVSLTIPFIFFNWADSELIISGVLSEDIVSIRNVGTGSGQVGLSGNSVTFAGTVIGTLSGGNGSDLSIIFNSSASTQAVEAVIENLTYANTSDDPTPSRDLVLNLNDSTGDDILDVSVSLNLTQLTGASNPFDGIDVGNSSAPSFADIDGDGDQDLVLGASDGTLRVYQNDGNGVFAELTGANNPFDGLDFGSESDPSLADIDGDGDVDLIVGSFTSGVRVALNDGSGTFSVLSLQNTPFINPIFGSATKIALGDIDNDGDADVVIGELLGTLETWINDGTGTFTALTGANNPFNGVDVGTLANPHLIDLNGDGDLDLVVGSTNGALRSFDNVGGVFTELTGVNNPFNGITMPNQSDPSFADIDGDGDADLIVGGVDGTLSYFQNNTSSGLDITVTVIAENDAPTIGGDLAISLAEGATYTLTTSDLNGIDGDHGSGDLTFTVSSVTNGAILVNGVSSSGSQSFTQDDLANGLVEYLHNGSSTSSFSFFVSLVDGSGASATNGVLTVNGLVTGPNVITGTSNGETLNGTTANDEITALGGNDTLIGGVGNDTLIGGSGADILEGGVGADSLQGGSGVDVADYRSSAFGVTVNLEIGQGFNADASGDTLTGIENVYGSNGEDNLTGDALANFLRGQFGNDILSGGGGADVLRGGSGADTLIGGTGNDNADYRDSGAGIIVDLAAGTGSGGTAEGDTLSEIEQVRGSDFADTITGDAQNNFLRGFDGADILSGGDGRDFLRGGDGADTLIGGAGKDTADYRDSTAGVTVDLAAGTGLGGTAQGDTLSGIEQVQGSEFADTITGNSQNNFLRGFGGVDVLNGGVGNDQLRGGDGADILNGGNGRDILRGGEGADVMDGGTGVDIADYGDSTAGVTVDLTAGTGSGGAAAGDTLSNIEQVYGSNFADVIAGDGGENFLRGFDGADTLNGGGGRDTLRGGEGGDFLIGGGGVDTADYRDSSSGVTVDLDDGTGTLGFGIGGTAQGDTLSEIEDLFGSGFADTLTGDDGENFLYGFAGNDFLFGEDGEDVLTGGAGTDQLSGGAGADRFVFESGWGTDDITDFQDGIDVLDFRKLSGVTFNDLSISQDGANTVIEYSGNSVILANTLVSTVDETDFLFS